MCYVERKTRKHRLSQVWGRSIKVPLKAKSVQIWFSQLHRHDAKYTFDTFTVYKYIITEQIESMGR